MKVRVKTWEEIEKTLNADGMCGLTYFDPKMKKLCGEEFEFEEEDGDLRCAEWWWKPDWLEPVKPKLTVEIDPDNPAEAHYIVSEAIKQYRYGWTEEEIAEAIRVTDEEILKLHHEHKSPVFYCDFSNEIIVSLRFGTNKNGKAEYARPCYGDIPNVEIGRCVAICKLTGRKIPEFIMKKGVSK